MVWSSLSCWHSPERVQDSSATVTAAKKTCLKKTSTHCLENEVLLANENLNRQTLENATRELELHKTQLEEFMALMLEKNTTIEALQSSIRESPLEVESNSGKQNSPKNDDVEALFQTSLLTETDWHRFQ